LVHIHGNVAIVTGKYRERIKVKGKPVVLSGRFTGTWIQEKNQWKCVASQSTRSAISAARGGESQDGATGVSRACPPRKARG